MFRNGDAACPARDILLLLSRRAGWESGGLPRVTIRPDITVGPEDQIKAARLLESAKRNCFVSSSLKGEVILQPQVRSSPGAEAYPPEAGQG